MDFKNQLEKENARLQHYNYAAENEKEKKDLEEGRERLAYRTLNSRYIDLEKTSDNQSYSQHQKVREQNKKEIENRWHSNTEVEAKALRQGKEGDKTKPEYYAVFTLRDLEVLLKNSNRGGNSGLFNDVVTDLELLNNAEKNGISHEEIVSLSLRLEQSCEKYISKRNPYSTEGKVRKAIITQVKSSLTITRESLWAENERAMALFDAKEENDEDKVNCMNKAVRANFDLASQYMQGTLELSKEQVEQLDTNMGRVFKEMYTGDAYKVDANQNKDVNTRFFNALGWTERKPRIVDGIFDDREKGPRPDINMYHTINNGFGNVIPMVKQLMGIGTGKSRHYMSDGYAGKGTYLASEKKGKSTVAEAQTKSWSFGTKAGSAQLTMAFNERTRLVKQSELDDLKKKLCAKFPSFNDLFNKVQALGRSGDPTLSIVGAVFGYNATLSTMEGADFPFDYYVAFDRSALTIEKSIKVAKKDNADEDDVTSYDEDTVETFEEKEKK